MSNDFSYANFLLFLSNPWNWAMFVVTMFSLLLGIIGILAARLADKDLVETSALNVQLMQDVDELAGTKYLLEAENRQLRMYNATQFNHPIIRSKNEFDAIISMYDEPMPDIDAQIDQALILGNSWVKRG